MKGDVVPFVSKYRPLVPDFQKEINIYDIFDADSYVYLAFLDVETEYPTFCDIIDQFCSHFFDRKSSLVLCYYKEQEKDTDFINSISGLLNELQERASLITIGINEDEDEKIICRADCLILGRDKRNINRISYAMKYGIKLMSGVNKPIFA